MRVGLGPVFRFEWVATSRNWRVYALRVVFGLGLMLILSMVALAYSEENEGIQTIKQQAEAGRWFAASILFTELVLLILIAPAATAGTLCLDKARGTLAHVLTTDLNASEIIFGKLVARVLPSLGLIFSSLGMLAICTLMGGIDPVGLAGSILVILGVTALGASLSLFLSVWATKTHEVVMTSYLLIIFYLLIYPGWYMLSRTGNGISTPPEWLEYGHPFWLVASVTSGSVPIHRHLAFLLVCLAISAVLATVATACLRGAAIRQMNKPAGAKVKKKRKKKRIKEAEETDAKPRFWSGWRIFPTPSLDGNPVLWREWQRRKPSRWSAMIWRVYLYSSIIATGFGVYSLALPGRISVDEMVLVLINGFQVALGLLLMSVSAATSLAEERVRGSLDVLLTTSLPTRSIVWGKWWGTFRSMPKLAILPAILVAASAFFYDDGTLAPAIIPPPRTLADYSRYLAVPMIVGLILAYGAALTSLGLVMATWIGRLDRAVSATVTSYVFMTLVWPILMAFLSGNDEQGMGLTSGSPFMGVAATGAAMVSGRRVVGNNPFLTQLAWSSFWILAYFTIAALLLKWELSRFNRKLGRTPDEGMIRRPTPPPVADTKALVLGVSEA